MPDINPALELAGIDVSLGGRTVLRDVDLRVKAGEFVGLLGPNGAGKTTLLRTALGIISPLRGSVLLSGEPAAAGHARIGYVPQRHDFAWDFPISVETAVMSGRNGVLGPLRRPGRKDRLLVDEALERVRLGAVRRRPIGELSGGQRQRMLLARALVLDPHVLLLDEPFTGLDIPSQELLGELFSALADDGRAVLMSTHDLLGALHGCDRLALLDGTVVASGPPKRLAADKQPWMRTFGVGEQSPLLKLLEL